MVHIPTTREIKDNNLSNLESKLSQQSPLNDIAFLKVLSATEAIVQSGQYKYAAQRAKQNLIITATGDDLKRLGAEYNVIYKEAEATILTADLPAEGSTFIPTGTRFKSLTNGFIYITNTDVTASGGVAQLNLTSQTPSSAGNLTNESELRIQSPIAGAQSIADVTGIVHTGTDDEDQEVYRERISFAATATFGGGNSADYKLWAEEVSGVKRAYPFTGKPAGSSGSCPGDRTVFVEATTAIDPDGIPTQTLLDEVRESINFDPDSGESRSPIGLVDSLLYVEPIVRNVFYVKIIDLVVDPSKETALKADIEAALDKYFREIVRPYVVGIDSPFEKNNIITQNFVSDVVADPLKSYSASCSEVQFSRVSGVPTALLTYTLGNNETAKRGDITYV